MTPPRLEVVESKPSVRDCESRGWIGRSEDLTSADGGSRLNNSEEDVAGKDLINPACQRQAQKTVKPLLTSLLTIWPAPLVPMRVYAITPPFPPQIPAGSVQPILRVAGQEI
jgi:hypothetical protein